MEWQPIETAPQDGTAILACDNRANYFQVVSWDKETEMFWEAENRSGFIHTFFTHWMHLPELPA